MSASEKAFGLIKTVFTFKEQQEGLEKDLASLSERITRLAESHVALRERVGRIEGYLDGRADEAASRSDYPRLGQ